MSLEVIGVLTAERDRWVNKEICAKQGCDMFSLEAKKFFIWLTESGEVVEAGKQWRLPSILGSRVWVCRPSSYGNGCGIEEGVKDIYNVESWM